jgi:hypothetical protein
MPKEIRLGQLFHEFISQVGQSFFDPSQMLVRKNLNEDESWVTVSGESADLLE